MEGLLSSQAGFLSQTQTQGTDLAAALLRVTSGGLFVAHALLKLVVFTPAGTAGYFQSIGLPGFLAYVTIAVDLIGGLALIAGRIAMSTASAPVEIGHVALTVKDPAAMRSYYQLVLGMEPLASDGTTVSLGAAGVKLLELRYDPAARQASPREAGLFHTAFLMPDRAALARWLIHVSSERVQLQGASDHLVSEAIYLSDPEGNGIEVYVDRPRSQWQAAGSGVRMASEPLDLKELAGSADGPWQGAPDGLVIGHVHLQVGDMPRAEAFWRDTVGMPVMATYPGAAFYGSGGYHHHIATNIWNSRGAGNRSLPAIGLAELVLRADVAELRKITARAGSASLTDPWGIPVTVLAKAA